MKAKFTDTDSGWKATLEGLDSVEDMPSVSVGFYDEHNATKAAANEFGTSRIPERPFMRRALDANADKYFEIIGRAIASAVDGNVSLRAGFIVGNEARNDIIDEIHTGSFQPNADSTADAKGFNAPLIDTGEMQRALTFKVGDDGEGE